MSETQSPENILLQVAEEEREYDWSKAASSYEKTLGLLPEGPERARVHERLGYALYRAAMQTDSANDFSKMMHEATFSRALEIASLEKSTPTTSTAVPAILIVN